MVAKNSQGSQGIFSYRVTDIQPVTGDRHAVRTSRSPRRHNELLAPEPAAGMKLREAPAGRLGCGRRPSDAVALARATSNGRMPVFNLKAVARPLYGLPTQPCACTPVVQLRLAITSGCPTACEVALEPRTLTRLSAVIPILGTTLPIFP